MCLRAAGVIGCAMTFLQDHTPRSHWLCSRFLAASYPMPASDCNPSPADYATPRLARPSPGALYSCPWNTTSVTTRVSESEPEKDSRHTDCQTNRPAIQDKEHAMHVGYAPLFQNPGNALPDAEVYRQELRLAEMAEPLGFDSIWSVEHHFTDYTMCPDVLQFLTYMAGRTTRVSLGSMVVVLPWHDPMRVAEEVSMLDNICGGRFILGLGRGAAKVEFEGFRVAMGESRERFVEDARMILEGLEKGYCEFDGQFVSQPRADIRPAPFK